MKLIPLTVLICGPLFSPLPALIPADTIGTTGVDLQNYGPAWQRIYYLPEFGIYTAWVKTGMWANFYSFPARTWSGEVSVFGSQRNAGGNLAVCTRSSSPYYRSPFISSYINREPRWPIVAVESIPGSGIFSMRPPDSSLIECQRPPIAFTANNHLHLLCADPNTADTLLYSRSTDYGITWTDPIPVCGPFLPENPTYSIAGSENSSRLAAVWTNEDSSALWINISEDGGINWTGPQNIFPVPTAITSPKPGRQGAYAIFDRNDRLNVVTQIWDGTHQYPAEIWHWQENRSPAWSLVFRFAPGSVLAGAEPGDPFVLRPTIGQKEDGTLFVLWLNYDSLNYEPLTQIARADLFIAQSQDNGLHWSRPFRLTGPDNCSRLSPCLAPIITDSLFIICVIDQLAGIYEQGHGSQTVNPVVVLRVPVTQIPGISEAPPHLNRQLQNLPTIIRTRQFSPRSCARFYDLTGKKLSRPDRAGVYFLSQSGKMLKLLILP
ncbi:MAG: glycoside hydrolase [candidate division WOR-3 bacterium]|uniref:Exo-alpha-sialidase n=1 Tax=candidate division WOR-3 bacterium TaxID=2052148 RepID=A0A7C3IMV9_UNCW3|nr:glycoside hydrolase [candidate division WOR-3 bacterium]